MTNSTLLPRSASITRRTLETDIKVELTLEGDGHANIHSGIPFLDHMLTALTIHARWDLDLKCQGDLQIDDHHTAEDCALALGAALDQALADRRSIARFASAYAPLDESLVRAVIDLSGRPFSSVNLGFQRDALGSASNVIATENVTHFFQSLATSARMTLHLDLLRGDNDHHRAEAAFKAVALALRAAIMRTIADTIPSTKGII